MTVRGRIAILSCSSNDLGLMARSISPLDIPILLQAGHYLMEEESECCFWVVEVTYLCVDGCST